MAQQSQSSEDLARQFGGQAAPADLASQFGGRPVDAPTSSLNMSIPAQTGRFVGVGVDALREFTGLIWDFSKHPWDTTKQVGSAMLEAQGNQAKRMAEAFEAGDYRAGVLEGAAYLTPILGPAVSEIVHKGLQSGDWATATGELTTLAAPLMVGSPIARRPPGGRAPWIKYEPTMVEPRRTARRGTQPTATEAAIQYGLENELPMTAGRQVGGHHPIKMLEQGATKGTIGGGIAAIGQAEAEAAALARLGGTIRGRVGAGATTPEAAGQSTAGALQGRIGAQRRVADTRYDALRAAEEAAPAETITTVETLPTSRGAAPFRVPTTVEMKLPVDLRPVQAWVKPIVARMERQMSITQQQASRGLKALRNVLEAGEFSPLTLAEADLGAIKAMLRKEVGPTQSASMLREVIRELDAQVRATARGAGPEIEQLLLDARSATRGQWTTQKVLDRLVGRDAAKVEPVQAFRKLTANEDASLGLLRQVARESPGTLPQVGRAWLDNLMSGIGAEGTLTTPGTFLAKWNKLGAETKALLFKPQVVADLDKFFQLVKTMGEEANPSGTAFLYMHMRTAAHFGGSLLAFNFAGAAGVAGLELSAYGLVRALQNPTAAKALIKLMQMPRRPAMMPPAAYAASVGKYVETLRPYMDAPDTPDVPSGQFNPQDVGGR
jgi:hypothetical protein